MPTGEKICSMQIGFERNIQDRVQAGHSMKENEDFQPQMHTEPHR